MLRLKYFIKMWRISLSIVLLALLSLQSLIYGEGLQPIGQSCEESAEDSNGQPPAPLLAGQHRCTAFDNNDIKCKKAGCEYNLVSKKCLPENGACPPDFFDGWTDCLRFYRSYKGIPMTFHYNDGGVLCENKRNDSNQCKSTVQTWGINFNGKSYYSGSRKSLYWKEEGLIVDDPQGIRFHRMVVDKSACHSDNKKQFMWNSMMGPVVTADKTKFTKGKQACLTYYFKICNPGIHELSVLVFEGISTAVNQRCFDIKIGDMTILKSIDPYGIAKMECGKTEIITLFNVSEDMTKLYPKGFDAHVPITDKEKIPLRLCTGTCGAPDETFQLSAASVYSHGGKACTEGPWSVKEEEYCLLFHDDPCACTDLGSCQYDLENKKCVKGLIKACPNDFFNGYTDCIRSEPNMITAHNHGGLLCNAEHNAKGTSHTCPSATQNWAVNFNGKTFVYPWRNTIYYKDVEKDFKFDDPHGIKINREAIDRCAEYNWDPWYDFMMRRFITADMTKVTKREQKCVTYYFKVCSPGIHELSLFIFEDVSTEANHRCFDVKMGDLTVLKNIDSVRLTHTNCVRYQIIVMFNVMENMKELHPKGFSTPVRFDDKNKVPLRLCTGTCGNPDEGFQLSSASVHKLGGDACSPPPPKYQNRCHAYHDDEILCKFEGCQYNVPKATCVGELKDCPDNFFDGVTECRRWGPEPSFYQDEGVFCKNTRDKEYKCPDSATIWSVNFGGEKYNYDDYRKTVYGKDESSLRDDPQGIRLDYKTPDKCKQNKDPHWDPFFQTGVTANKEKITSGQQACLTYYFKVCQPGTHELSLWILDGAVNITKRCFDVKIGDLTIMKSIDPRKMSGKECSRMELLSIFYINDKIDNLTPKGFSNGISFKDKNRVPLNLCTGECGAVDETFAFVAASVTKLGGELKC